MTPAKKSQTRRRPRAAKPREDASPHFLDEPTGDGSDSTGDEALHEALHDLGLDPRRLG